MILYRINKLEFIKQWRHKGGISVNFDKLNLIYGRNGSGKTTLSKIFECVSNRNLATINSLVPMECNESPNLQFLFQGDSKTESIDLSNLNNLSCSFHVFNKSFIENNLYSSKGVESSQLVNYYEFCLGSVSVLFQKEIDKLKLRNDALTNEMSPISSRIRAKFGNKAISEIKKIKKTEDPDKEIEKLNNSLVDIQNTEHFKNRRKLTELSINRPVLDISCFETSISQLSLEAQQKVEEHIKNNLKERNTSWLEDGLELVTGSLCPFCGQSLAESQIYHLYHEFINESYLKAISEFKLKSSEFELEVFSIGVNLESIEQTVKTNQDIIREWSDRLEKTELDFNFDLLNEIYKKAYFELRELIKAKEKDFLSPVDFSQFKSFVNQLFEQTDFSSYNSVVIEFNKAIDQFISGLGTTTSTDIAKKINLIKESKERFNADNITDLVSYDSLDTEKKGNTKRIDELRVKITEEQESSIGKYKKSINRLLKSFNSMIRISELAKDNKGHKGATRITYVITFIQNNLSVLNDNQKIFDHVLSTGDKSALALAFFLSKFQEVNTNNSIVVLDDPISSLDVHRKDATINEIEKLIENGYQTFVLSHDPFFLSDVLKHSILSKSTKCYEIDVSYVDINPYNAHSAQYITSRLIDRDDYKSYVLHSYYKEYCKLQEYVESPTENNKTEVARSIRPILEAYMRFLFPTHFPEDAWLGDMIAKIRDENDEDSIYFDRSDKLNTIEDINEFSKTFHHSDGFDTKIQSLDLQTVKNYAKETLCFITGL